VARLSCRVYLDLWRQEVDPVVVLFLFWNREWSSCLYRFSNVGLVDVYIWVGVDVRCEFLECSGVVVPVSIACTCCIPLEHGGLRSWSEYIMYSDIGSSVVGYEVVNLGLTCAPYEVCRGDV
jgi:hypothetical protein